MSSPNIFKRKLLSIAVLSACGLTQNVIAAEVSEQTIITAPVVITATRVEQNSFDLPVAIDVVEKKDIQDGQLQMTLSESLIRVPGITAQSRTQMSQDPQISTRGFGARSSFGVRGIRIYVDGIPLSMPDGSGTPGSADLSAIKSIEVMRGPFSALYGSSSGGVIQLLTEDAPKTPEVSAGVLFGSYNTTKENLRAAGTQGGVEYMLNLSNFESDGYRDHSASKKEQATAKFKFNLNEATRISVLANWFDQEAQDPLGLKRTAAPTINDPSAFITPQAVPAAALRANTRVSRSNRQIGINVEHEINESNSINLISYIGHRDNLQFLSTSSSTTIGRASQIAREFWGSELNWTNKGELFSRAYSVTAGITYGSMHDDRMDISATAGVMDAINTTNLNRSEANIATNSDKFIQAQWSALENVDLHVGVRRTKVNLKVEDNLFDSSNSGKFKNGSGAVTHEKTTPVIGAVWKVTPALNLYTNYGKGFETPTFIEVAYSDTSGSGPNLNLKPSTSDNYEIGLKSFVLDNTRLNLAVFRSNTENEIVAISGIPYAVYKNAGKTKREGIEVSAESQLDHNIGLYAAYTYLNAKFDSAYTGNGGTVPAGNYIPGTYRSQFYGEVSWKAPSIGFSTAFEGRYNSKVYVDDVNSDAAPSYSVFNLRAGFKQNIKNWSISEYARIENLFDKDYIGSVRVNDTNSRFFEPAAGRNWLMGLNVSYRL